MNHNAELADHVRAVARNLSEAAETLEAIAGLFEETKPKVKRLPRAPHGTVDVRIRDAIVEFGATDTAFTMDDLIEAAAPVSKGAAYRSIRKFLDRGVVEKAGRRANDRNRGFGWQLYKYVQRAPESDQRTIRQKVADGDLGIGALLAQEPAPTGKQFKVGDKQVAKLLRRAAAAGAEIEKTNNGHYKVLSSGRVVTVISGTPSDQRAVKNAKSQLKKAGLA